MNMVRIEQISGIMTGTVNTVKELAITTIDSFITFRFLMESK